MRFKETKLITFMVIKQLSFKKLVIWIVFYISQWYATLWYKKGKWQPKNIKWYGDTIKPITQHSYFEKKTQQVDG